MIPALTEQPIKTNVINTSIDVTTTNPTVIPDPFHVTVDNPTTIPNPVPVSFSTDYVQKVVNETDDKLHTTVDNDSSHPVNTKIITNSGQYIPVTADPHSEYKVRFETPPTIQKINEDVNVYCRQPIQIVNYTGSNLNVLSKGEYRFIYAKHFWRNADGYLTLPINILAGDLIRFVNIYVTKSSSNITLNLPFSNDKNPNLNPDDFIIAASNSAVIYYETTDKINYNNSSSYIRIINDVSANNNLIYLGSEGLSSTFRTFAIEVYRLS